MITIVHSVGSWLPITETWLHTQVASLTERVACHILCSHRENLDHFSLPNIHCSSDQGKLRFFTDRVLRIALNRRQVGFYYRKARSIKPDVWHSHFAQQAWCDRHVVDKCGAMHILSVYGADISQSPKTSPWNIRVPEVLGLVDVVLCEGPAMFNQVIALGCSPERVRVHHLGIPLDRIPFQPRRWHPDAPLRVLIAGTFREKKGIPYALEALALIADEVNLEVTLIGDATLKQGDLEEKAQIMAVLERSGLISKTRLLGFVSYPRLLEEAHKHHVFLSPSVQATDGDNEGGAPVIITEMAASGMVIISSRHCDIPEVIIDGVTGLLADERDVAGLVYHLRWLISNPERWLTLQIAARNHVEHEYNASVQGVRLAAIYRELLIPQPQSA